MRAAVALVCALLLYGAPARGEVALAPGSNGEVGAWLVAGPLPAAYAAPRELANLRPALGAAQAKWAPQFRLFADGVGPLDLGRQLGTGRTRARAVVGAVLELQRDLHGWLLLSVDGEAVVYAGGREVFRRDQPHGRDRSIDAIPLTLSAGRHALLMLLGGSGERWQLEARLVDRERLAAPEGASVVFPGAGDKEAARLQRDLATVELRPELGEQASIARLRVAYARGAPRGADLSIVARLTGPGAPADPFRLGAIRVGARGTEPLEATLPLPAPGAEGRALRLGAEVRIGSVRFTRKALVGGRALAAVARARRLLEQVRAGHLAGLMDAQVVAATLEFRIERVMANAVRPAAAPSRLDRASRSLVALSDDVASGADPLQTPGVQHLARYSGIDGRPQRLWVHVPRDFTKSGARRYPLVLALHGLGGRPRGVLQAFLDRRSDAAHEAVDGFVIAPDAHGNAFYRGPGEAEVMATLDWALATYPIDPARVSVTGVSMGGTGTTHLAFRYADRFSAAAPLCGYHSFFIRRDTQGKSLAPWENFQMHHWSPVSWAERGRHLPLYVAHGTRDFPLENSRVLIRRYRELGYDVSEEWPDIGHAVWEKTYAKARLWSWLSQKTRPAAPERVTLTTDSLRHGSLYWARVTGLRTPGARAQLDVRREGRARLVASTSGVTALELQPPGRQADAPLTLEIDGQRLDFAPGAPVAAHHADGGWRPGRAPAAAGTKRAGLEGPIRDVFLGKVVFVWGSLEPSTRAANREVAEVLARGRHGVRLRYPVVADRDLSASLDEDHALFLVGTAFDHLLLRQIAPRLPIAAEGDALRVGQRRLQGKELGALFIHPDPRKPTRYVVVLTAPSVPGIYRALSLPELLPDYVVYDSRLAPATGQQVLGAASVVYAGHFGWDWSLP